MARTELSQTHVAEATVEAPPLLENSDVQAHRLSVKTLNLQYFASYPKDEDAARLRLLEITGGDAPPDVICVQEALASKNVLRDVGFDLQVCAGARGLAQSVNDMVYGDAPTLRACDESSHAELLCNQIYTRRSSGWLVVDSGAMQISSDLQLVGGGGRAQGKLAVRSMVWVKLCRIATPVPAVYVMNTHISGGRFEDQYFVQQLANERFHQPDRVMKFFNEQRPNPEADDIGIIVGDFNATPDYMHGGPMSGYFKASITGSPGVQADADAGDVKGSALEECFKAYMISPFAAFKKHGWSFAYGSEVGVTSGFGHLVDHMAMSRPLQVFSAKVSYLTNQKVGNKPLDTDLPLSDHNSVKTVFLIPSKEPERKSQTTLLLTSLAISVGMGIVLFITRARSVLPF